MSLDRHVVLLFSCLLGGVRAFGAEPELASVGAVAQGFSTPGARSPSLPCTKSAQAVCSISHAELCILDTSCSESSDNSKNGCNAGGVGQNCRFCGFGNYQRCPLRGSAGGRNTIGWSRYVLQAGPYTLARVGGLPPSDLGHVGVFFLPFDIRENWGRLRFKGKTCKTVEYKFGKMNSLAECAMAVGKKHRCGPAFMWSNAFSAGSDGWACRCCKDGHDYGGDSNEHWDVYQSYLNWMAFDGEPKGQGYYYPPDSVMKIPPHGDGECGADFHKEAQKWLGYAFETTFSNGNGGEYSQTYAFGQAGRYIFSSGSGSRAMWEGKADKMAFAITDLTFDQFMQTSQSFAYHMNRNGGYDASRNSCQDFARGMMENLHVPKAMADALHEYMLDLFAWQVNMAIAWCAIAGEIFGSSMCWPDLDGVPMPHDCKDPTPTIPWTPVSFTPKYYGDVILVTDT